MDLDAEIAEARAQRRALEERAKTDPVAALVVKRLEQAEKEALDTAANRIFGGGS